jgi:Na+-transporting NADH:ubiquinone oxidoreductase subunit NqrF
MLPLIVTDPEQIAIIVAPVVFITILVALVIAIILSRKRNSVGVEII